jgi:hypothetical protein
MTPSSRIAVPLHQRMVWLRIVLSDRYSPDRFERFRRRLSAYLGRSGISPVTCATRIALLSGSHSITPFDVCAVVAWLVEQPEVVMVCRERPPLKTATGVTQRRTHD